MQRLLILLIALATGGCSSSQPVTTENAAKAMEGDLVNRAAELDANVNAEANKAAAAAMAEARVQASAMGNAGGTTTNVQ